RSLFLPLGNDPHQVIADRRDQTANRRDQGGNRRREADQADGYHGCQRSRETDGRVVGTRHGTAEGKDYGTENDTGFRCRDDPRRKGLNERSTSLIRGRAEVRDVLRGLGKAGGKTFLNQVGGTRYALKVF